MLFNDWLNKKLKEVGKTWHDFTKAGIGGQTMYNIQHGKYRTLKDGTCQKLALVLELCQGDIRDAIAQSIKEEDAGKEAKPTIHAIDAYMEEDGLPFSDLETEERQEEPDVKWYKDRLKEDAPEKVKVKEEALNVPKIHISQKIVKDFENIAQEIGEQAQQTIMTMQDAMSCMGLEMPESDPVNHPAHYTQGGIECIEAIEASMSKEAFAGYLKGNMLKYVWRYQHKGGVEDLRKAQWYLNRLIEEVEK